MGKSSIRVRKSFPRTRRKVKKTGRKRTRERASRKHRRTRTRRRRYKGGAFGQQSEIAARRRGRRGGDFGQQSERVEKEAGEDFRDLLLPSQESKNRASVSQEKITFSQEPEKRAGVSQEKITSLKEELEEAKKLAAQVATETTPPEGSVEQISEGVPPQKANKRRTKPGKSGFSPALKVLLEETNDIKKRYMNLSLRITNRRETLTKLNDIDKLRNETIQKLQSHYETDEQNDNDYLKQNLEIIIGQMNYFRGIAMQHIGITEPTQQSSQQSTQQSSEEQSAQSRE